MSAPPGAAGPSKSPWPPPAVPGALCFGPPPAADKILEHYEPRVAPTSAIEGRCLAGAAAAAGLSRGQAIPVVAR